MTLDVLVNKYHCTRKRWEQEYEKAEGKRKKVNDTILKIQSYVKKDFKRFIKRLNSEFPLEQKITKWRMEDDPGGYIYSNGTETDLEISIEIEEIGGKICIWNCNEYEFPIPPYLNSPLNEFTNKYKIPIRIWIINSNWDNESEK